MTQPIHPPLETAVVAAAGVASRMWPASKAIPKELFPLGRLPALAHLLIEFHDAGIRRVILVVGPISGPLIALLDPKGEPPAKLRGDPNVMKFQDVLGKLEIVLIRQIGPYGNGVPAINAMSLLGDAPFIYAFSDDVILGNASRRLRDVYDATGAPCFVMDRVPEEKVPSFGIAECVEDPGAPAGAMRLVRLLEKPRIEETPSRYAVPGRYVVTPELGRLVASTPPGKAGELWFTDGLVAYLGTGKPIYALPTEPGAWLTVGDPDNYARAVAAFQSVTYA
jgi:UTP--glucose-1-phosphate uridylyltransferase